MNTSVVVTDGAYRGWVGYVRCQFGNWVGVRLFGSDGTPSNEALPLEYVQEVTS